ncbi:daptide biosynthesis RiPP recognition protein [Streptomyces rimosus]|uniref:daptide biosynthesis RiPP recognition protein n=1 Tax=Streptomyces rimosus TaxID=1927 RepID=UPI0007C48BE1|nr:daptide biosynthesis RiPP recognition protein [Streptomyces rimosus]
MVNGIKGRLTVWATGQGPVGDTGTGEPGSPTGTALMVLESPEHLAQIIGSDLVSPRTTLFVPGHGGSADGPHIVGYEGSLSEPGTEFSMSSGTETFYLQLQSYGISEYMSVIGPTLIRIADAADFAAFLADADRARLDGVFPDFLGHPVIQLADLAGLGAAVTGDGPRRRLYAGADGRLSLSPGGRRLGSVGDDWATLQAEWSRVAGADAHSGPVCLGDVLPEEARVPELASRPWLSRYFAALDGIRRLRVMGLPTPRVSGFGGRLMAGLPDPSATTQPSDAIGTDLPLLLWTDEEAYLHSAVTHRTFRVGLPAAELVEALLACGSVEAAASFADRDALRQVATRFGAADMRLTTAEPVTAGA